jgi:hypothetical protein
VVPSSDLGKSFDQLAKLLTEKKNEMVARKRRFVDYFSLVPARYRIATDGKKS